MSRKVRLNDFLLGGRYLIWFWSYYLWLPQGSRGISPLEYVTGTLFYPIMDDYLQVIATYRRWNFYFWVSEVIGLGRADNLGELLYHKTLHIDT